MGLKELVHRDENLLTIENIDKYRLLWSKTIGHVPRNSEIWPCLSENSALRQRLMTRKVRTSSGVAPFAVMLKPFYCPGECIYCPLEKGMPKSYLSDEPAAQRAKALDFDPVAQVSMRIKQLEETGHITDKIDLIIVGGTFGAYDEDYRRKFVKGIYDGINEFESGSLEEAIKFNENWKRRVVGLSVETRPDWVTESEINLWREMGVTKVQLGVQAFDDEILRIIRRGHGLKEVAEATRMCRNAGIKICYHLMPNLPGSNPDKDLEMARLMFEDERFQPDYLKVYPAMIIPDTEMYEMWKRGKFEPYSEDKLRVVLKQIMALTPEYCRIDRFVRDISKKWVANGSIRTNLRQEIEKELINEGTPCKCIRCREVGGEVYNSDIELKINQRHTLGGDEYFLSFEGGGKLFSMLRLRVVDKDQILPFAELSGAAIIREVHTYGRVEKIGGLEEDKTQHRGLGKKLMEKAEEISLQNGLNKIAVISAVGTREYYRKLGYALEGSYMVKVLK